MHRGGSRDTCAADGQQAGWVGGMGRGGTDKRGGRQGGTAAGGAGRGGGSVAAVVETQAGQKQREGRGGCPGELSGRVQREVQNKAGRGGGGGGGSASCCCRDSSMCAGGAVGRSDCRSRGLKQGGWVGVLGIQLLLQLVGSEPGPEARRVCRGGQPAGSRHCCCGAACSCSCCAVSSGMAGGWLRGEGLLD